LKKFGIVSTTATPKWPPIATKVFLSSDILADLERCPRRSIASHAFTCGGLRLIGDSQNLRKFNSPELIVKLKTHEGKLSGRARSAALALRKWNVEYGQTISEISENVASAKVSCTVFE
jgi:hypothetical protein